MSRLFKGKGQIELDEILEEDSSVNSPLTDNQKPNTDQPSANANINLPFASKADFSAINPIEALKDSVKKNVTLGVEEEKTASAEQSKPTESVQGESAKHTEPKAAPVKKHVKKKTSSLLAKCMPYIYDDEGNNYAEEKPDYTLESVEDIIESAEKRANEKIARMYNLKPSDLESIGSDAPKVEEAPKAAETRVKLRLEETSIKKPLRIGEVGKAVTKFDTVQIPKISKTLFDDFSARRTDIIEKENVTTTYSEQGGINSTPEIGSTRIIPELRSGEEAKSDYEDILSNTRPVNVVDISSGRKTPVVKNFSEAAPNIKVDDFCGKHDIVRVGSDLKLDMVTAKFKCIITFFLTLFAASVHFPFMAGFYSSPILPAAVSLISFAIAMLLNLNIFTSFKGAFTTKTKIEFPLALAGTLMTAYIVWSIICGKYPYEPVVLPLIPLFVYDYCCYKKAAAVFANFKIVALRKTKSAVTLINNSAVNTAMARSVIQGEILTAGTTETDEIKNFLRHTLSDHPFGGKINLFTAIFLVLACVISAGVGVSYSSLEYALLAAASVMSLAASPSLFISDMLPFAGISEKLRKVKAAVCSKYSAERIEEINALVISSTDIFPSGTIKLFDMSPLSANSLDDTIIAATAVLKEINSPLFPVFNKMVGSQYDLPVADTVKYEENLGISGWVGDNHIMIGNRSLMQSHGVKIPDLEVDRKMLHKGFFPVYVACDQRACALLMIKYSVDSDMHRELCRLSNKGITLLIDNCDPNITEQMLCDYFGLYPDIVKVIDHNGVEKYREETAKKESVSAHGFHKGNALSFLSIISQSIRIRTLSSVLYVLHVICSVVICLLFAGISLNGSLSLMSATICAMCQLVSLVVSLTAYYVGK